jgi:hypothetical protein
MKESKHNPSFRPMTDQAFPAPDDNRTRKPQSIKQRIEGQLSDRIDFKLTTRTKDRLSNKAEDGQFNGRWDRRQSDNNNSASINPARHPAACMPHINSWSDSRPQNNPGI